MLLPLRTVIRASTEIAARSLFRQFVSPPLSTNSKMSKVFYPISETLHLAKDSSCPPVNPKVVRLYSMKFCPYAQRTRLILAAKRIENEVVNIHLFNRPQWFYSKNPLGKVPCLEINGTHMVYESLITADYLDEVYPSYPMYSKDPLQKAQDRMFMELFNKVNGGMFKLYRLNLEDESSWKVPVQLIEEGLAIFEDELARRGTPFFGADRPGMLDYMIWPWMERLPMLDILAQGVFQVPLHKFSKLTEWCNNMKNDDAVKESYISPENHAKYIKTHLAGNPDYDMALD